MLRSPQIFSSLRLFSLLLLFPCGAIAQSSTTASSAVRAPVQEYPVVMQQKIQAGKTPVGTKVLAKLVVATLVNGFVYPRNAIFSGEVTESVARNGDAPSHLAVRMHSLQWRDKSTPLEVDLCAWIYPMASTRPQDLSFEPPDAANSPGKWNGGGAYPDPNNPVSQEKFPGRDSDRDSGPQASSPSSQISKHRVMMKGVVESYDSNNRITLSAAKFNVEVDRMTTYVLTSSASASK
ncbi:hypothetical protein Acid345_0443 [Candidatus Koribacter versatilis Ellin345]|uniref:Uncharacterized protein n=1 Tax=Koribacter versatilis (strain Ellin345) TaxID=204669 RepID=Q1IUK2_KORVE|nr:hypothetical protein [Candidatus Koribacter versatilis]ABF39448.1 hypothetical protein Acid345_0443 [Candidatus Koribacter versatilis Ellin345]